MKLQPPCPECLPVGLYKGQSLCICSSLAQVDPKNSAGVLALTSMAWRPATNEEITWVRKTFPQYFTMTGRLSQTYFAMKKLLH